MKERRRVRRCDCGEIQLELDGKKQPRADTGCAGQIYLRLIRMWLQSGLASEPYQTIDAAVANANQQSSRERLFPSFSRPSRTVLRFVLGSGNYP